MKSAALLAVALLCCASVASARLFSSPEEWKAEARRNLQGFGGGHEHGHEHEHKGRYGVYGQGTGHRYGVYGQEHKHRGYGAYGHPRRLASIDAGATRELQGLTHGHKHHGRYSVYGQGTGHRYGVYGQEHKHRGYGAYGHPRRLASIEAGATRELQGLTHSHKHHGRYGVYGQGMPHRYGVYGQEHKHRGYGAYGHPRRLASIEAGATRELQGFASHPQHGHKHHGRYGVYGQEHKHRGYGVYGQGHKGRYGAYSRW